MRNILALVLVAALSHGTAVASPAHPRVVRQESLSVVAARSAATQARAAARVAQLKLQVAEAAQRAQDAADRLIVLQAELACLERSKASLARSGGCRPSGVKRASVVERATWVAQCVKDTQSSEPGMSAALVGQECEMLADENTTTLVYDHTGR